jgi:D-alanyl-D-alanine dipeptidase
MTLATVRIEDVAGHPLFRHLSTLDALVDVDLRYPTPNNFAGRVLYVGWDCAWLRHEAAAGLEAAARWLASARPGWRIRLLDALRPHRVQEAIWRDVVGTPMQDYFADPARGSIHSFGMAVDVTLLSPEGEEADMGSAFDEMTLRSHPSMNDEYLALGVLSVQQVTERGWLHAAMARGGFRGIPTEWWHFDHGDRAALRRSGPRVN